MKGWSGHMFDVPPVNIKGNPFGKNTDGIKVDIKVENPQPYLNQKQEIPKPVVKKGK